VLDISTVNFFVGWLALGNATQDFNSSSVPVKRPNMSSISLTGSDGLLYKYLGRFFCRCL